MRNTFFLTSQVEWKPRPNFSEQYACLKKLGQGGQAAAYLFENKLLARKVVAKIYNDTAHNRETVSNEIKVLKHLNVHGCNPFLLCFQENFVVPVQVLPPQCKGMKTDTNFEEQVLIVVYDYFFGPDTITVATVIQALDTDLTDLSNVQDLALEDLTNISTIQQQADSPEFQFNVLLTLVKAVAYLHEHGVAHMDIKPANVIINLHIGRLQIIDFGISCMETKCSAFGTVKYSAPEVLKLMGKKEPVKSPKSPLDMLLPFMSSSSSRFKDGDDTTMTTKVLPLEMAMKADAWSIGMMLYEFLQGGYPFQFQVTNDIAFMYGVAHATQNEILPVQFVHDDANVTWVVQTIVNGFLTLDYKRRLSVVKARDMLQPWLDKMPPLLSPSRETAEQYGM